MAERNCLEMLKSHWAAGRFVCGGLDSDASRVLKIMAAHDGQLKQYVDFDRQKASRKEVDDYNLAAATAVDSFNRMIIGVTHGHVCAYKINSGFYEALGPTGVGVLGLTIDRIHDVAPGVPVILDWKRGDIGNTNEAYVQAFDYSEADAMTANPYLGFSDGTEIFLRDPNKMVFVLCRTSNAGSRDLQDLICKMLLGRNEVPVAVGEDVKIAHMPLIQEVPLYMVVANMVANDWNQNGNCGLVMGANFVPEIENARTDVDLPFLMPGGGAQKADIEAAVRAGQDKQGGGMVVNYSREILFACEQEGSEYGPVDFEKAALAALLREDQKITSALAA